MPAMARPLVFALLLTLTVSARVTPAAADDAERARVVHVLDRMAFGGSPGDVDRVLAVGVERWVKRQLDPDAIAGADYEREVAAWAPSVFLDLDGIVRKYRPDYKPNEPNAVRERRDRNRGVVTRELRDSVLHRAVFSPRRFEEVMVNFWRNHFSIDQSKDELVWMAPNFERDVLRKHAFGKFERLLLASARHPAMLTYLDNVLSQRPLSEQEQRLVERYGGRDNVPRVVAALGRERGLNENYARELMELHTLGVDRRYRQIDVTELSRVLTGWSARLSEGGGSGFNFRPDVHDDGKKWMFGTRLRGDGEDQGVAVIRGLARHKLTAEFISRKLCVYLVSDTPGDALVDRVARVFRKTKGDLPKVYAAIVTSPEFRAEAARGAKFKTPFEFAVSALRATGAEIDDAAEIHRRLEKMGQPIYRCLDPDGYADTAEAWLDPGVLVHRWAFAWDLAHNDLKGVRRPDAAVGSPDSATLTPLRARVTRDDTRASVAAAEDDGGLAAGLALLLGSPEFQRQ